VSCRSILRNVLLMLLTLELAAVPTLAQGPAGPFHLASRGARVVRVPLRVRRNLLLVPVMLNGQGPFQFVLDTGVETMLLTDPAVRDSLKLPPGRPILVEGAGEDAPLRAALVDGVRVALPGVTEAPLTLGVLSGDALELSRYVGESVAGLIGADVFASFVVEVRPGAGQLRLHDPAQFQAPRRAARLPLQIKEGKPYVRVRVGPGPTAADTLTALLLIDTGAGHALSLETGSAQALHLPDPRLRAQLGRGLSGPVNGWIGRVATLDLGPYQLQRLLTSFPDSGAVRVKLRVPRQGNLGFETLKRFRVWFDYAGRGLWLRPSRHYHEPFEHDMSGLEIVARGPSYNRYVIESVKTDSPGEEAGLLPGDELLIVNAQNAAAYTLTTLSQLLHAQDGLRIPLLVRRESGRLYYTTLVLRRVI
jgi:PDZ domain/Aspartyl protease